MTTRKKVSDPSPDESLLEMDTIVADLRNLRMASLEQRKRHDRPPRLPSRKILADITDGLSAALFPNRLGSPKLTDEDIDHYVGKTLDKSLKDLLSQVQRELNYASTPETTDDQDLDRASAITHSFAKRLPASEIYSIMTSAQPTRVILLPAASMRYWSVIQALPPSCITDLRMSYTNSEFL